METYPTWPNLAAMMFGLARTWPDKPLLRAYRDGRWDSVSWGEFGRRAASCARHLRAAGVAAGDRVVIAAENRPEYPIAETALMAIRAVPVPAYTTNTVADHAHILRDSGARAAIVSSADPGRQAARGGAPGRRPGPAGGDGQSGGSRRRRPSPAGSSARRHTAPLVRAGRRHGAGRRHRPGSGRHPGHGSGLPDLHLRHRRRSQGRDAAAPLDPVELPRRLRAAAAAAATRRNLPVLPARLAQLRAHRRPVLPPEHRHRDRLCPRRGAFGGGPADRPPDHHDGGAARAGGDPQPRADPGGAAEARGGSGCSSAPWRSA